eukprot:SAG31_NODE_19751_length_592_cov_1.245436_1_plen_51_part_10
MSKAVRREEEEEVQGTRKFKKQKQKSRNPRDDSKGLEVPKNVSGIDLRLFS